MDIDLEERMISAQELFHYARRFRDKIFCLFSPDHSALTEVLPDIRILLSAGIKVVVCCPQHQTVAELVRRCCESGDIVELLNAPSESGAPQFHRILSSLLSTGTSMPVVVLSAQDGQGYPLVQMSIRMAKAIDAVKFFMLVGSDGLTSQGHLVSHLSSSELESLIRGDSLINLDRQLLQLIQEERLQQHMDIVLLGSNEGNLFQEVFTHSGAGTLISDDYPNVFRQAKQHDVRDIHLLLRPYISSGAMLPISDQEILNQIEQWYVYTINGQIVATARLTPFGNSVELGKIATLPRYQGKGRASELIGILAKLAEEQGREALFALTLNPKMADVFLKLGFSEVPRESLPAEWQTEYDFGRPSKAYLIAFNTR